MKGLQSYEDMQREHGLKRMTEGLRALLGLHTPPELSSICGVLKLPVKEKGSTSLKAIIDYASQGGKMDPDRTKVSICIHMHVCLSPTLTNYPPLYLTATSTC